MSPPLFLLPLKIQFTAWRSATCLPARIPTSFSRSSLRRKIPARSPTGGRRPSSTATSSTSTTPMTWRFVKKKSGNLQWKFVQVRNPEGLVIFTATHTNQPKISIRATKPIKKSSMVSLTSTEYRGFLSDPGFPRESAGCAQLFVEFLGRIPLWIGRNI